VPSAARHTLLKLQKPFLDLDTAGESAERPILPYHAVAGDEQRDGIFAVGPADCPACPGAAYRLGDIFIGARLAERYPLQRLPDPHLKGPAAWVQPGGKMGHLAREKVLDLL